MADYSNYGKRRFWCEICKTSMPYTKSCFFKAITDHERSQKHKKQADRHLQDEQRKNRQQKNTQQKPVVQKLANGYTANELQELKQQFETNPHQEKEKLNLSKFYASKGFAEAKMAVVEQQKKVTLQEQNKNNPFYDDFLVWRLQRDESTGKLCFYNQLSKVKQFEKPFGLKLSQQEQRLWEQSQNQQQEQENINENYGPTVPTQEVHTTQIGQWEIVDAHESFFEQNRAKEEEESEVQKMTFQERKQFEKINAMEQMLEKIQQKQIKAMGEYDKEEEKKIVIKTNEIFDELLEMNNEGKSQNSNKLKSDRLKQLVEKDIEVSGNLKKPVFNKKDIEQEKEKEVQGSNKMFKKRVLNNKKVVRLVEDEDQDSN